MSGAKCSGGTTGGGKGQRKGLGAALRTIWLSCTVDSRTSFPIPIVICPQGPVSSSAQVRPTTPGRTPAHRRRTRWGTSTHVLQQLDLGAQPLERLVVLALQIIHVPMPARCVCLRLWVEGR